MKKFFTCLLVGIILSFTVVAFADQPIKLIVNGKEVPCDPPPQFIGDRVFVPVRFVAEALGAKVEWDSERNAVVILYTSQTTQQTEKEVSTLQNNNWISLDELIRSYGVFVKVGNDVLLKRNNVEIKFSHPTKNYPERLSGEEFEVITNIGTIRMKVFNGRFIFYIDDLKRLNLIP